MLKGIDINETLEFVSTQDSSDNPTRFLIKNIPIRSKMSIFSGALDKKGDFDISKMQEKAVDIFKAGVAGILNLNGVDYKEVNDEVVNRVSFAILIEVVGKVLEFNFASEGEAKN